MATVVARTATLEGWADLPILGRWNRGRERPICGAPPPSEPDGRFSRIRLSGQWAPFRDRRADALAVVIVNSPSFAK